MENSSKHLGVKGEELAKSHLQERGHHILASNWRFRHYEVDLISRLGSELIFTEVKTRSSGAFGEPELFVSKRKQQHLIAAAGHYLSQHALDLSVRFDIIAVLRINNSFTVKHLEDAFYPSLR